jgi:prepilin-type processing-associated H-X9-DG protein
MHSGQFVYADGHVVLNQKKQMPGLRSMMIGCIIGFMIICSGMKTG